MALMKHLLGGETRLPQQELHEGYIYFCHDTNNMWIDYKNEDGVLVRSRISAEYADKLRYKKDGETIEINPEDILKIDERLSTLEDDAPISVKNTSLTVPANSSVTYTTLWNYALVGLTTYTDHELNVNENEWSYMLSDLYVTDPNDMGYIAKSIETGVSFDFATDIRGKVNQGMPYPTDGSNLGLKFWNTTDTDIIVQISESRLNEELLKYLVTTGQHNADKVFPSVDTFWSMNSLSSPVSFTAKYTDMVVTHERNIYYYDPSGEYSESPSGKIGICRDYVAVNQQSATNCTRYQWFKDFEGNEYYRKLTSGTVTQAVNDDGSYTWTISNWTVSSDWELSNSQTSEESTDDNGVIVSVNKTFNVPANSGVTYTVMLDDSLKAINLTTSLQGYPSSGRNDQHYGICVHDDHVYMSGSTIDCVYSNEVTDLMSILPNWYSTLEGGMGTSHNYTLYNHTSTDAVVYVEEKRFNAELVETFATKEELETKAEVEDVEAINSELVNKISISDAENMTTALDNGNIVKITNLTIPSGGTATYTFLWEESGLPNTQFSCDNPVAISPTEEYTGVRIVGKNNSTMSHIVYGEEPVVISEIGESTLIYGGGFTKGAENTFTIHNHTSSEVVVKIKEFESSKIDERLTALEVNKKVPATFNSLSSSLDNSSTEFVVSSGGVCEPWVEFDVGMPYNDSTSVINNGSSFGGYLTTRYYLRYMGSVENSNIARQQTVIVENTNANKDEIYIRRGHSGITIVSQNTDGSYVCKSNNSWTNTTWTRIDAGALEGRIATLEATLANIQNAEEVSF